MNGLAAEGKSDLGDDAGGAADFGGNSGWRKAHAGNSGKRDRSCSRGQREASRLSRMTWRGRFWSVYRWMRPSIKEVPSISAAGRSGFAIPLTCSTRLRAFLVNSIQYPWDG